MNGSSPLWEVVSKVDWDPYAVILEFKHRKEGDDMAISLQKGQRVDLTKGNAGLKNLIVGLGWDPVEQKPKGGLFSRKTETEIDCDASALMLNDQKKVSSNADIIYFGNLSHVSGALIHQGDNLTGEGDGDDEQIIVSLDKMPAEISSVVFVVNIYQAVERSLHFGMIENAFIRVVDGSTNNELLKYNLSEGYEGKTALVVAEIYRHGTEWKFAAIGEATEDKKLQDLILKYK
jgi:tellurium resistance protein TerD